MSGEQPVAAPSVACCEEQDMPPTHTTPPPTVLESRRFGSLEVQADRIVTFPAGLLGFEEFHDYLRVAPEALAPLTFLVACEDPDVAFPVLPCTLCLADYAPKLPPEALAAVGVREGDGLEVLAICALAPDTGTLHANLQGPVLINPVERLGCQVVLHDSPYSLRHLLGKV
jgi:flagellar assembly factor FliW